jgi:hypothetical protein
MPEGVDRDALITWNGVRNRPRRTWPPVAVQPLPPLSPDVPAPVRVMHELFNYMDADMISKRVAGQRMFALFEG